MFVIAVTGGLGSGKTEAVRYMESRGAVAIDLDEVAKGLLQPETEVHDALVAAFGEDIVGPAGAIVHRRLADEAFSCDATAATLDAIVHPRVAAALEERLESLALQARPPAVVVIEVPLLVETPATMHSFDLVVTIGAPEDVRLARALDRGMSEKDARARMARQADDERRAAAADVVLDNRTTAGEFRRRLDAFWEQYVLPRVSAGAEDDAS
jgi:dephospho-CoA kinase